MVEDPVVERVSDDGVRIADHTLHQSPDDVSHEHGRQLAAGNDEVTDGDLIGMEGFLHTLIETFVATAKEDDPRAVAQFVCSSLIENAPGWGGHHDMRDE